MADIVSDDVYFQRLGKLLSEAPTKKALHKAVVNAPFSDPLKAATLDLGVVVLLLVNDETDTIDRVALSNTYSAQGAVQMSAKPFNHIKVPLGHPDNIIARAIASGQPQQTYDWPDLFVPALTPKQARLNQAGAGIECSAVYPLPDANGGGALIFSFHQPLTEINDKHHAFMAAYTKLVSGALSTT